MPDPRRALATAYQSFKGVWLSEMWMFNNFQKRRGDNGISWNR